jgi:hypothetical protein
MAFNRARASIGTLQISKGIPIQIIQSEVEIAAQLRHCPAQRATASRNAGLLPNNSCDAAKTTTGHAKKRQSESHVASEIDDPVLSRKAFVEGARVVWDRRASSTNPKTRIANAPRAAMELIPTNKRNLDR